MNNHFTQLTLKATGAKSLYKIETIQSLTCGFVSSQIKGYVTVSAEGI